MAAKKKDLVQIVKITHEGQDYTARWSTRAFRQFLIAFKETQKAAAKEGGGDLMSGIDYIEIAHDVLDGMMIRAGMSSEGIENVDAQKYMKEAAKLSGWFQDTMELMNEGANAKNEGAETEAT